MEVFVGKEAHDFTAKAVLANNTIQEDFNLKKYLGISKDSKGSKCVLFFYPLDFTFVCPSEIIAFNNRIGEFLGKNVKVVGVSVDSHFCHLAWKSTPYSKGGIGNVQFPLVADLSKAISKAYNILNEEGVALRGTFIIDQDFILRHITVNDLSLGRNIEEALRIIDMIDHSQEYGEVCPAEWRQGKEGMKPTSSGVSDYLTSHAEKL